MFSRSSGRAPWRGPCRGTDRSGDSISALPIVLNYKPVSHNEGTATYFREMLRLVMNAERPKRNQFYTEWFDSRSEYRAVFATAFFRALLGRTVLAA